MIGFVGIVAAQTAAVHTYLIGRVLQVADAGLVAVGAVQGMVLQGHLHNALLRMHYRLGLRAHHHAFHGHGIAGREWLWRPFDLYHAHATRTVGFEKGIEAQSRNVGSCLACGIEDSCTVRYRYLLTVNC